MLKNHYISYAGYGIGRIIETKNFHGLEMLRIQILANDLVIMVPKSGTNAFRSLMTLDDAQRVKAILQCPADFNTLSGETWKKRMQKLVEKFKSNNPILLSEIVAELTNRKINGSISYDEKKMLDGVKSLLETELALIEGKNEKRFQYKD